MHDQIIDIRSDTVTRPTPGMLEVMFSAKVGDDVFDEDPSVIKLEEKAAAMFGKEAGLFCPSGTMTNQIAVKVHTRPGDEVICDELSHLYNYEGGGVAFNSGASVRLIKGNRGRFTAEDVTNNINPDNVHFPRTTLVAVENTSNRGGGSCYDFSKLERIAHVCRNLSLKFHLDGARLFNALAVKGKEPIEYGELFDSISICLSKSLGAPVGSLLLANKAFIKEARRVRKVFGGGMRQAGYLAAAGIYALENNIKCLNLDHQRAKAIEDCLNNQFYVKEVVPVETNIIVCKLTDEVKDTAFITRLQERNIKVLGFGPQTVRMVTHLDFDDKDLEYVIETLDKLF